jgi:hypothetical protein
MVIEYIRYQVPAANHADFIQAYRTAGEDLAASSHCSSSPEFASFFAKVKPYFPNIREMKHYQRR